MRQIGMAIFQLAQAGRGPAGRGQQVLDNARRSLYGILADD